MRLEFFLVVAGTILLGLGVIGRSARSSQLRFMTAIACAGLAISFIAGLGFYRWNRTKAKSALLPLGSKQVPEPIAAIQSERMVSTLEPRIKVKLTYFTGTWKNVNPPGRGITRLHVRTEGESVWVHAWEKCNPTDCDWGEASGTSVSSTSPSFPKNEVQKVTATFQTSFSDTMMTLTPVDESTLEADTQTRFTDNSGRSGYSATYTFRH